MDMVEAATRVTEAVMARSSGGSGGSEATGSLHGTHADTDSLELGTRVGVMWGVIFKAMLKAANE